MTKRDTTTYTSGCYFCHALKLPYDPPERDDPMTARVDWHEHVLAAHTDLQWTADNEASVREFIANHKPGGSES